MVRDMCVLGIVVALLTIPVTLQPVMNAQPPMCLHGPNEMPDQAARRKVALASVRRINSLQTLHHANGKTYQPLSSLPDIQTPAGFSTQLVVHSTGYVVSLKDKLDPCRFAYFSDQEEVIYTAQAIR
jgi:hypothetical protein